MPEALHKRSSGYVKVVKIGIRASITLQTTPVSSQQRVLIPFHLVYELILHDLNQEGLKRITLVQTKCLLLYH